MGVDSPLPVQREAVPLVLHGRNVAVKSCAGSGKVSGCGGWRVP